MMAYWIRMQMLKAEIAARNSAQQAHDSYQRAKDQDAESRALYDAMKRDEYGRDAIDVEVHEVPDVLLIEAEKK